MKKLLLSSLLITCWALTTSAQQVYFGLHGAYTTNTISTQTVYSASHVGINMGAHVQYSFNDYFAAYTELNYEQKGAEGTISFLNSIGETTLSYNQTQYLNYATLPVLFRASMGNNKARVFANAGMYYGFLFNAWVNPQTISVDHDITANFNHNDFGLAYGIGLSYQLNKQYALCGEWRMNNGLVNISKTGNNQLNQSIVFQLGFNYLLGAKSNTK